MACRSVDVGVTGERKDRTTSSGSWVNLGAGRRYVRFVVDASKVAPK
jgi:hypothetical protein